MGASGGAEIAGVAHSTAGVLERASRTPRVMLDVIPLFDDLAADPNRAAPSHSACGELEERS